VSISATCDEFSQTELRYENCTHYHVEESSSMMLILTAIGIGIVVIIGAVAEASVYCLRRASRGDTADNEHATSEETSANQEVIFYSIRPNNIQKQNDSHYCEITLPRNKTDVHSSPQYDELTWRQSLHDTGTCSNLGTVTEATMATGSTAVYAELFQYTTKVSETYAVPYHEPTPNKEGNEILYENMLHCESKNDISSPEVSVRNSLYLPS
jgi:hypothetical protein